MAGMTQCAAAIERSRQAILDAVGDEGDLALVRNRAGLGDELSAEGARALFGDRDVRELDARALTRSHGEAVLLAPGAGFSRSSDGVMQRVLTIAQMRFEHVIVLPCFFDPSDDAVRRVLADTHATVFASDPGSREALEGLCDARLACDCGFFFDYSDFLRRGQGVLNAFGAERPGDLGLSGAESEASTLAAWLEVIAGHELVRTDRAHTMIAAALMGKQVEYPLGSEPLALITECWLADRPVTGVKLPSRPQPPVAAELGPAARQTLRRLTAVARGTPPRGRRIRGSRITAVVLTRDRPRLALRALRSLAEQQAELRTLVIDNNSASAAAAALARACAGYEQLELRRSERNLGCGGGRRLGASAADSEFVLFLDDDAELLTGAVDHLLAELDEHPEAGAATATVVYGDGTIMHSGGTLQTTDELARFELVGFRRPFDETPLAATGQADWVPGTAVLIRRELLESYPIDDAMAYFEDNEWCYRIRLNRAAEFRRSREALALHADDIKMRIWPGEFRTKMRLADWLSALAIFYKCHGLVLGPMLFDFVPELRTDDRSPDLEGAQLLMELVAAKGTDWVLMEWINGELGGLLRANRLR